MNDSSICNRFSYDADKYRKELVERLSEIANRMDAEIGLLIKKSDYSGITQEFERYTFGLISDVLLLKYFHKDNPDNICKCFSLFSFSLIVDIIIFEGINDKAIDVKKTKLNPFLIFLLFFSSYFKGYGEFETKICLTKSL